MSVVGAWLGTRGSTSRASVDETFSAFCIGTDGGGSANSVVDNISRESTPKL